jgi:predicted phosphodiesterase
MGGSMKKHSDETRAKALELRKLGMTYGEIEDETGIKYRTIQSWCQAEGLDKMVKKAKINKNVILKELVKERETSYYIAKYGLKVVDFLEELKAEYNILQEGTSIKLSKNTNVNMDNFHKAKFSGKKIKFGIVSDTHLGSKFSQVDFLHELYDYFEEENVDCVYHAGDISDGYYTNRSTQVYELLPEAIGFDRQVDYISEVYPRRDFKTYFITGNHDFTHLRNGGADIGKAIANRRDDMIHLGLNNAKVFLTPNCVMEINHPGDGSSYALSYSAQKYADSMEGGKKPNILINGHHHKLFYMEYRNIHILEAGTTEMQTDFMRGKRIASHVGAWLVELEVADDGTILKFKPEMIKCYETRKAE